MRPARFRAREEEWAGGWEGAIRPGGICGRSGERDYSSSGAMPSGGGTSKTLMVMEISV